MRFLSGHLLPFGVFFPFRADGRNEGRAISFRVSLSHAVMAGRERRGGRIPAAGIAAVPAVIEGKPA